MTQDEAAAEAEKIWNNVLGGIKSPTGFKHGLNNMLGWFAPAEPRHSFKRYYAHHYQKMVGEALLAAREALDEA